MNQQECMSVCACERGRGENYASCTSNVKSTRYSVHKILALNYNSCLAKSQHQTDTLAVSVRLRYSLYACNSASPPNKHTICNETALTFKGTRFGNPGLLKPELYIILQSCIISEAAKVNFRKLNKKVTRCE